MPHLFTVRWPVFARMEVILFFPFALRLASETGPVRVYVDKTIMPALAPVCAPLGLSDNAIFWLAMTAVVAVPYLITLIVADRLMTVRKGYALLSVVAIALWAFALSRLSSSLIGLVPDSMLAGTALLSFDQEIALAAAGVALVPHLWPLWIGLRDDGAIAMRLLDSAYDPAWRSGLAGRGRQNEDLYRRQTAAFREWRNPQQQFEGLGSGPRENSAASVLHLITWVGVILGIGGSYLNWAGVIDLHHQGLRPAPAPGVAAGPLTGGAALKPVTMPPVVQVAPALPMVNSHVVSVMPLPMVQRPTELSSSVQSANRDQRPQRGGRRTRRRRQFRVRRGGQRRRACADAVRYRRVRRRAARGRRHADRHSNRPTSIIPRKSRPRTEPPTSRPS